jgi:hypothetical protein
MRSQGLAVRVGRGGENGRHRRPGPTRGRAWQAHGGTRTAERSRVSYSVKQCDTCQTTKPNQDLDRETRAARTSACYVASVDKKRPGAGSRAADIRPRRLEEGRPRARNRAGDRPKPAGSSTRRRAQRWSAAGAAATPSLSGQGRPVTGPGCSARRRNPAGQIVRAKRASRSSANRSVAARRSGRLRSGTRGRREQSARHSVC